MTSADICRHEVMHALGYATHLADQVPPRVYRAAKVLMYVADGEGRCFLDLLADAGVDRDDLDACAALAPAALAPRPIRLVRAPTHLQRAAGLSERDIGCLRKWRGKIASLERMLAAVTQLARTLPVQGMVNVLVSRVDPEHPLDLSLVVPRSKAAAALAVVDRRFHERRRDPRRAPSFAERPL